jgi:hypothetical protein
MGEGQPADQDRVERLRVVLAAAYRAREFENPELREAVAVFARTSRAAGTPPERMFLTMAALLDDPALAGLSDWWRSVLRDRLLGWGIETYYHIDLGRRTPLSNDAVGDE